MLVLLQRQRFRSAVRPLLGRVFEQSLADDVSDLAALYGHADGLHGHSYSGSGGSSEASGGTSGESGSGGGGGRRPECLEMEYPATTSTQVASLIFSIAQRARIS